MPCYHVIGATGFIGKPLLDAARRITQTYGTSSRPGGELTHLSFEDPGSFDYGRISSGDVVFVTAAISSPDVCAKEWDRAWQINVEGTSAFISQALQRGAQIVFFSSDTVYGEREPEFDETAACAPCGEYAEMKRAVEERFEGSSGFKVIRLSYVFAKNDKFTNYLMNCEKSRTPAEIFHPFFRAPIHRDDVIAGALTLAQQWDKFPAGVINFGGPEILSRIEFAQALKNTVLPVLEFKVTEPDGAFFKNRPRFISMRSPILKHLLGRRPRTLAEAAILELNDPSAREH